MKNFILGALVALMIATSSVGGAILDRVYNWSFLDKYIVRDAGRQLEYNVRERRSGSGDSGCKRH